VPGLPLFSGRLFSYATTFLEAGITSSRRNALRLLQAILKDPLDLPQIEAVVRDEPALTYKLLRYLNSPVMERRVEVRSIRTAISLLGSQEFRRWASLLTVVTPAADKANELLRTGLTRAYFCKQLALRRAAAHAYDFFFTGLISVMDAVLDRPVTKILNGLSLSAEIRTALSGDGGAFGNVYETMFAYEKADWDQLSRIARNAGHPEEAVPDCFVVASARATGITR